jgi:hypothetical protein
MTITLDTADLLESRGAIVPEITHDALGADFDVFLGALSKDVGGRPVLVLPAGQRPEVRDCVVRQLLQHAGKAGGQP